MKKMILILRNMKVVFAFLLISKSVAFAGGSHVPRFVPLVKQQCSIHDKEAVSAISKLYANFINVAVYDRTVYFQKTRINPIRPSWSSIASARSSIDSLNLYKEYKSGTCVGMGLYLKERFKEQTGLNFQVVTSPIPKFLGRPSYPKFGHTASILKCTDGYIFLDPSLGIRKPLVVSESLPAYVDLRSKGMWKYEIDSTRQALKVTADSLDPLHEPWTKKKKADYATYFPLAEIENPDESITFPCLLHHRKFPIFKITAPDQSLYILTLNLERNQLEYSEIAPNGHSRYLLTLDIEEYYKAPETFKEALFSAENVDQLGMDRTELLARIVAVLESIRQ